MLRRCALYGLLAVAVGGCGPHVAGPTAPPLPSSVRTPPVPAPPLGRPTGALRRLVGRTGPATGPSGAIVVRPPAPPTRPFGPGHASSARGAAAAGTAAGTAGRGRGTGGGTAAAGGLATGAAGEAAEAGEAAPGPAPAAPGGWRAPLAGRLHVARPFDPPANPYGPGHRGVDLAAAAGTPVTAAGAGTVTYAAVLAGRGVVVVSHGSLRTTYEPVRAAVRRGDRVGAGQLLGWLVGGHPGCPAAACLHWGLLAGSTYLDPLDLLRRPTPRLLPLVDPAGRPVT